MQKNKFNLVRIFFFCLVLSLVVLGAWFFHSIFTLIIISLLFAYLLNPLVSWMERKHLPRALSIIIVYVVILLLIALAGVSFIPRFVGQMQELAVGIRKFIIQNSDIEVVRADSLELFIAGYQLPEDEIIKPPCKFVPIFEVEKFVMEMEGQALIAADSLQNFIHHNTRIKLRETENISDFIIRSDLDKFIKENASSKAILTGVSDSVSTLSSPFMGRLESQFAVIEKKIPFVDFASIIDDVADYLVRSTTRIPELVLNFLGSFLMIISFAVTIPIIGFFLLLDHDKIKNYIIRLVPNRYFELFINLLEKIDQIIGTYLRAMMIEILAVSALTSTVLGLIGVKYGLIIGVLAGLANAIPYFGPWFALLAAFTSVLLTGKPLIMLLYVFIGMQIVQFIDNSFNYPIVIGRNTEMHPLVIMLTVIAGGFVFGLLGMLLSVPILFLVRGIVSELYQNLKEFDII
ncbi:MAG: AI-2E family transporter [Candidatus Cloacimonetes bacterium]|nr:AI-2E family transporter [Candidatus Cloacimonadota bacterium]